MSSTEDFAEAPAPAAEAAITSGPTIKLKASLAPMTAIEVSQFIPEQFEQELAAKVTQAPGFFENLPVIIGLEGYEGSTLDFATISSICAQYSVNVIAVRGANESLESEARACGLGILPKQKEKTHAREDISATENTSAQNSAEQNESPAKQAENTAQPTIEIQTKVQASKVVQHPIRSGQQVYAADGDLIILSSVSAGAEILADGNIHVYGTLRGRALAGIKGNTKARVFCQSMAAELVSIAGQYKISEDIPTSVLGKTCQVYLDDDTLNFKKLEL